MSTWKPPSRLCCRRSEGERLYFALGEQAHDALVVVGSAGAVEVGFPTAFLVGRGLSFVDPFSLGVDVCTLPQDDEALPAWTRWIRPVRHEPLAGVPRVLLVDDGTLPPGALVALAVALRKSGPRAVVVAAPWVHPVARSALAGLGISVVPRRDSPVPEFDYPLVDLDGACRDLARVRARELHLRSYGEDWVAEPTAGGRPGATT